MAFADIMASDFAAALNTGEFKETWTETDEDGTDTDIDLIPDEVQPRALGDGQSGTRQILKFYVASTVLTAVGRKFTKGSDVRYVAFVGEDAGGVRELHLSRDVELTRNGARRTI